MQVEPTGSTFIPAALIPVALIPVAIVQQPAPLRGA